MNLYLITGTGAGLGLALAQAVLAQDGNEVVCISRTRAPGLERARFHVLDMSDPHAVSPIFDLIAAELKGRTFGKAVLINNAGVPGPVGPLERLAIDAMIANLNVNLVSAVVVMRCFLTMTEAMAPVRRVINISSGLGRKPMSGTAPYCAAKAGVDMVSRVAALEATARGTGVEIVSLAPGIIDTGMQVYMRAQSVEDLPDAQAFQAFKAGGSLRAASDVAADILQLEAAGKLAGEPVADLRTLLAQQ